MRNWLLAITGLAGCWSRSELIAFNDTPGVIHVTATAADSSEHPPRWQFSLEPRGVAFLYFEPYGEGHVDVDVQGAVTEKTGFGYLEGGEIVCLSIGAKRPNRCNWFVELLREPSRAAPPE